MTAAPLPDKLETRCKLCGHVFRASPFSLDLLGQARLGKFFQMVSAHIQDAHKDYAAAGVIAAYTTQDPALLQIAESARGQVHKLTRRNQAPNDYINDRLARAGFSAIEVQKILPLFCEMRDFLTEQGSYAPPTPVK